jgi:hypothetical protein
MYINPDLKVGAIKNIKVTKDFTSTPFSPSLLQEKGTGGKFI